VSGPSWLPYTPSVNDMTEFSTGELAVMLGVHRTTVLRMAKSGRIHGSKVGNHWRFSVDYLSVKYRTNWSGMKRRLAAFVTFNDA
jgi:excisionase family DNA binding protein